MNWLKVAAVVVGGLVVFFVVDSVIHVILGLITALVFVAIVGGGIYAAAKIAGARKRRALRQRPEYYEEQQARHRYERSRDLRTPGLGTSGMPAPDPRTAAPRPAPAAHHDVEDELARLKREMGS
jgi:hypothetical protein